MKGIVGILLVTCSFLMVATISVAASPSSGVHSGIVKQDMLSVAEFTPALRVFPEYGQPVMVNTVNIYLSEVPKEVSPSANSPPVSGGRAIY